MAMRTPHAINFYWLLRLRWGAVIGQVVVILLVQQLMGIKLPLLGLFSLVGISVGINLVGALWARQARAVHEAAVPILMGVDVLLLTGLLYFTGGPANPFSFLYIVHVAMGAVVLAPVQTWALVWLALGCLGALFFAHVPLEVGRTDGLIAKTQLEGMWVAFAVAAVFIVYFVQRVTGALASREAELARARELTSRNEKLASLATLSAGAAHELSTPLSTIALVAKELEHMLRAQGAPDHALEDAQLIREEVHRCRGILDQMAADAGETVGEEVQAVKASELIQLAQEGLHSSEQLDIQISDEAEAQPATMPLRAVAQAIRVLIKNALQASGALSVQVLVHLHGERWLVEVRDRGHGMAPEVLARAGEPFFTTKEPGSGMGLGLFLARAVIERMDGRLDLFSRAGEGTRAVVELPCHSPTSSDAKLSTSVLSASTEPVQGSA